MFYIIDVGFRTINKLRFFKQQNFPNKQKITVKNNKNHLKRYSCLQTTHNLSIMTGSLSKYCHSHNTKTLDVIHIDIGIQ